MLINVDFKKGREGERKETIYRLPAKKTRGWGDGAPAVGWPGGAAGATGAASRS